MLSLDNICPSTRVDKRYFKLFPRYNHFCYVLKIEILEKALRSFSVSWNVLKREDIQKWELQSIIYRG